MDSATEPPKVPEEFLNCIIRTVTDDPVYKVIGFFVAAFIPTIVALIGPSPDPSIYAISVLIVGHILISSGLRCKCYNRKYIKSESSRFEPFITDDERGALLPRTGDCRRLHEFAQENTLKYIVLVGRSGVGKSKLLQYLMPSFLAGLKSDDSSRISVIFFDNYAAAISKLVETLLDENVLTRQARNDVLSSFDDLRSEWSELLGHASLEKFAVAMERIIKPQLQDRHYYFVFDQAERALIADGSDTLNRLALSVVWEIIRQQASARVFLTVRSDLLFDCMDELLPATNKKASNEVAVFTLYGINEDDNPDEIATVRQRFSAILDADPPLGLWSALGLNNKHKANTFVAELFGYLLENLHVNEWGDQRDRK